MMSKEIQDFIIKAGIRALWTFSQVLIASIPVGATIGEVQWSYILSVGVVAALVSFLKSIVVGIPERSMTSCDLGTLYVDNSNGKYKLDLSQVDFENITDKKVAQLMIVPTIFTSENENAGTDAMKEQ